MFTTRFLALALLFRLKRLLVHRYWLWRAAVQVLELPRAAVALAVLCITLLLLLQVAQHTQLLLVLAVPILDQAETLTGLTQT
jgi:hypothetical protein